MRLALLILALVASAAGAEGVVYDTYLTPQVTALCKYAPTREDGSAFLPEDYGPVQLFITKEPGVEGEPYYNGAACRARIQLSAMQPGQYYRHWRQYDNERRRSRKGEIVPFVLMGTEAVVSVTARPRPPTDQGMQ